MIVATIYGIERKLRSAQRLKDGTKLELVEVRGEEGCGPR
jgi:hypothetical protein